jgi:nuclear pore complex protein Nup133
VVARATPPLGRNPRSEKNIFQETDRHVIEPYAALPYSVLEELNGILDLTKECSVYIHESEYAWAIIKKGASQQLYFWKCKKGTAKTDCLKLSLPNSNDLPDAKMVALIVQNREHGLLYCSPEGTLRYWPRLADPQRIVEVSLPLQGEERCNVLSGAEDIGYLLGSSTGRLFHVAVNQGSAPLRAREIVKSSGMLGGLGRLLRLNKNNGPPVRSIITSTVQTTGARDVWVLNENILQRWQFSQHSQEKLISEWPVQALISGVISESGDQVPLLQLAPGPGPNCLTLLSGFYFHTLQFAGHVEAEDGVAQDTVGNSPLSHINLGPSLISSNDENVTLMLAGEGAYAVAARTVQCCQVPYDDRVEDGISFESRDELVIGTGVTRQRPDGILVVSPRHGIILITQPNLTSMSMQVESRNAAVEASPRMSIDSLQQLDVQIKTLIHAVNCYITDDHRYQDVAESLRKIDLNDAVIAMSQQLVDAKASAERWSEDIAKATKSSASLLIYTQIEDKKRKHKVVLEFLVRTGLWEQLSATTRSKVLEFGEKLHAAASLRSLQNTQEEQKLSTELMVKCINAAISERSPQSSTMDRWRGQELFYEAISHVDDILKQVHAIALTVMNTTHVLTVADMQNRFELLRQVNQIFEAMLLSVDSYRDQFAQLYVGLGTLTLWTFEPNVREVLSQQIDLTQLFLNESLQSAVKVNVDLLFNQAYNLTDVLLRGYRVQLESLARDVSSDTSQAEYESLAIKFDESKKRFIHPFSAFKKFDLARDLAEKYREFNELVQICDVLNDNQRLEQYKKQFKDEKFPEFLFQWFLLNGRKRELLTQSEEYWRELDKFLVPHPELRWLHLVQTKQFEPASDLLTELALQEQDATTRRQTLFSLSKLSYLADYNLNEFTHEKYRLVDQHLYLLRAQSKLETMAQRVGDAKLEQHLRRPISPYEIIALSLGLARDDDSDTLTIQRNDLEFSDFLVAADVFKNTLLLQNQQERETLHMLIARRTLQVDPWEEWSRALDSMVDDRIEVEIRKSVLFQFGTSAETKDLLSAPVFKYLIETFAQGNANLNQLLNAVWGLIQQENAQSALQK